MVVIDGALRMVILVVDLVSACLRSVSSMWGSGSMYNHCDILGFAHDTTSIRILTRLAGSWQFV